ncbi:MAG: glutathione S-transferase [Candidatus Aldehydirespiratoraceae bacterium]|jgi:glutathione S-transferase
MSSDQPIVIRGAFSSPYSLKMRAVLRYRHIPFRWILKDSKWDTFPPGNVPVIPVLIFAGDDGDYTETLVDSSPQILRLEQDFADRSLMPTDPALAFIDGLIEDFADEWVTKMMYHYRWAYDEDIEKAGTLLPLDQNLQLDDVTHETFHDFIIERQVGRRALVGSTPQNQPIIEASFGRVLDILQKHFEHNDFLLGDRPGRGDFALYGQLKPLLWWDPTPTAIAVERSPKTIMWVDRVDDLSWWPNENEGWAAPHALSGTTRDLLTEAGRSYTPFMLANAAALEAGDDEVVCEIAGQEYRQAPFKYQAKCLRWLRDAYAALDDASRASVDEVLAGTGCEPLVG